VYRSTNLGFGYRQINDSYFATDVEYDIDSNATGSPTQGFVDAEQWDSTGAPMPRSVPGVGGTFVGPTNGTNYYYRVALRDPLGNVGTQSSGVSGMAHDSTPPDKPQEIIVTPSEASSTFVIAWEKVRYDSDGHLESDPVSYYVYRYDHGIRPDSGAIPLAYMIIDTTGDPFSYMEDLSPGLRDSCGEKTWFYRVEARDVNGNVSARSIAVGAALRDTTRPNVVKGTAAEGFDDYIRVSWDLNTDCDIQEYLIYRAYCDYGEWVPCPIDGVMLPGTKKDDREHQTSPDDPSTSKQPRACGGPFELIGTISHLDADSLADEGGPWFDDHTVNEASPICYAYLVKAKDKSQNMSGGVIEINGEEVVWPWPSETVICQRIRDRTPPGVAIISGLYARDSTIKLEYIGPPVQDIKAYHIYRSQDGEAGTFEWIGGLTVEPPPLSGQQLTEPYKPTVVGCDSIPLESKQYMSAGTYYDVGVIPKQIYWYKVVGVDQDGNETPTDSAVAASTFTFTTARAARPAIVSITAQEGPCALKLELAPAYDISQMDGYVVFRSTNAGGQYMQVGSIVKDDEFSDNTVARTVTYWYRVALVNKDGAMSELSEPVSATHP
jgi:hypothetical protein